MKSYSLNSAGKSPPEETPEEVAETAAFNETEDEIRGENDAYGEEPETDADENIQPAGIQKAMQWVKKRATLVCFTILCLTVLSIVWRFISHNKILKEYAIPEDAVIEEQLSEAGGEKTEYVDEVVYNPKKPGEKHAKAQNGDNPDKLDGQPYWYSGKTKYKWRFLSGYDYTSADIACIWVCEDTVKNKDRKKKKRLLAIHTADYDGAEDAFDNHITYITQKGMENLAAD